MYKNEIKKHNERERDFQQLENMINDLDRRSRILEVSITDLKKDHEDTISTQMR